MGRSFECHTGRCVECCTESGLALPITLSDIYRAWVYHSVILGSGIDFFRTYQRLSLNWTIAPNLDPSSEFVAPVILSKMPCVNVDTEKKICRAYRTYRYAGCALFPEDWLLPAPPGFKETYEMRNFVDSCECLKGVTLSEDRIAELKRIRGLADDEIYMTAQLLNSPLQPVLLPSMSLSPEVISEFERRLRYMGTLDGMRQLWPNLEQTMGRYAELFVDNPKIQRLYTQPTWKKILKSQINQRKKHR